MDKIDKLLGMDRAITRRDFVNGALVAGAGAAILGSLSACAQENTDASSVYPPSFTGMRGNHDSSFEVAHALGREGKTDWGAINQIEDRYDLVIVGAGISGLSAACFYRRDNPEARILLLDNHDDFGGHAKRNEVVVNGRTLLTNGGSEYVTSPYTYSDEVNGLFDELGMDISRLVKAADFDFFQRHNLSGGYHFNKERWGQTVNVKSAYISEVWGLKKPDLTEEETINQFPITEKAKEQLRHLFTINEDQVPDLNQEEKVKYFKKLSYRDFLIKHIGVTEQDVFDFMQDQTSDLGLGIEAIDTYKGMTYGIMPGWAATGIIDRQESDLTGFHMFPDGNATLSRLMVRSLIKGVASGNTMEDVIMARFDYGKLDQPANSVRIRLNSTVINATNNKDGKGVSVTYIKDEIAYKINASKCVLACNNAMIPYLSPELPESQKEALANQVRTPLLFTKVVVKNWRALKELGVAQQFHPGGYHIAMAYQLPLNLGDYESPENPDEPSIIGMYRYPHVNNEGLSAKDQFRAARYELLATPYEEIEEKVRRQLNEVLGGYGFNAAEDIEAIIVNRWAHGYSYERGFHNLFDQEYDDPDDERYPHVKGRKPFGRISIANSDAGAKAMLESAIDQAYRAITELEKIT